MIIGPSGLIFWRWLITFRIQSSFDKHLFGDWLIVNHSGIDITDWLIFMVNIKWLANWLIGWLQGQWALSAGETQDNQRWRYSVCNADPWFWQLRWTAQSLPSEISRGVVSFLSCLVVDSDWYLCGMYVQYILYWKASVLLMMMVMSMSGGCTCHWCRRRRAFLS